VKNKNSKKFQKIPKNSNFSDFLQKTKNQKKNGCVNQEDGVE
jgi:hypothetical protein